MTRIDLFDIAYLATGTERQRQAYRVLEALGILRDLATYTPALAGTIPLDIDIAGSDLDIICSTNDLDAFSDTVKGRYAHLEAFFLSKQRVREVESVVAGFEYSGWAFELFAQPTPTARQYACVHLLVEARLLQIGGAEARMGIRALKQQGMKTEPAFAHYFGLNGDPYLALAALADADEVELRAAVNRERAPNPLEQAKESKSGKK